MLTPSVYTARRSGPDAGESLQSDVMRFMAILSLCLVAIFTLVQTLPPNQPTTESNPEHPSPDSLPSPPEPLLAAPLPDAKPEPEPLPVRPQASTVTSPAQNDSSDAHQSELVDTLTLRFASDDALVALLTQRRIDVYAKTKDAAWVLKTTRGELHFAPSTSPVKFHQMSADTVPSRVIRVLERDLTNVKRHELTFVVTLPPDITQMIRRLANQYSNGVLAIHADGRILHQSQK